MPDIHTPDSDGEYLMDGSTEPFGIKQVDRRTGRTSQPPKRQRTSKAESPPEPKPAAKKTQPTRSAAQPKKPKQTTPASAAAGGGRNTTAAAAPAPPSRSTTAYTVQQATSASRAPASSPPAVRSGGTPPPDHTSLLQSAEIPREGLPPAYDDGIEWLRNGFRRHRLPVAVGIIFGWTGAWFAFWGALVGALLGVLVGLGAGNANVPFFTTFGLNESGSIVTAGAGLFVGALGGFLFVLAWLIDRPLALIGSIVAGGILSVLIVMGSAAFERLSLRIRGYRRLSRDEVRLVAPLVKSAADALNLPALPRFAMADQVIPNAWSHMRTIVLTTGILQSLEPEELEAILVHELTHWRNGDAVGLQCVWAASLPAVVVYNLAAMASGQQAKQQSSQIRVTVSSGLRWLVAWFVAWPAWVIVKAIIAPLTAATQRRYEYEADGAAYEIGLGPALASALAKLTVFEGGRTGWEVAMTATHPPTQLRIEALQAPRPDDWEYQEPELQGPSWHEIRRIFGSPLAKRS